MKIEKVLLKDWKGEWVEGVVFDEVGEYVSVMKRDGKNLKVEECVVWVKLGVFVEWLNEVIWVEMCGMCERNGVEVVLRKKVVCERVCEMVCKFK